MEKTATKTVARPRRVTLTLTQEKYDLLVKIASTMDKLPGQLAREMVLETLDAMSVMFEGSSTTDQAMRKMFKMAMSKMIDAIDEVE